MKNIVKTVFLVTLFFIASSCKEEPKITYKYSDQPDVIDCEGLANEQLLLEAFYSFEEDLKKQFILPSDPNPMIQRAYAAFISRNSGRQLPVIPDMVSQHSLDIYKELAKTDLFLDGKLNPNSKLTNCIANNIKNEQVKTTFNALKSTNSLSPELVAAAVFNVGPRAYQEEALKVYFAFGLYFAKFNAIDEATLPINKKEDNTNNKSTGIGNGK